VPSKRRIISADLLLALAVATLIWGCSEQRLPPAPAETAKAATDPEFTADLKRAETGDASAQSKLGARYYFGEGVPKDAVKAMQWYQKAAAQGDIYAQVNLGVMYMGGEGVPKDAVLAYAWSSLGAGGGNATAVKNRNLYESQLTPAEKSEGQRLSSGWKKGQILARKG